MIDDVVCVYWVVSKQYFVSVFKYIYQKERNEQEEELILLINVF